MAESLKSSINIKRSTIKKHDSEYERIPYKKNNNVNFTNLLVFGPPGTGKSKTTNSIFKSLHGNYQRETLARAGGGPDHITQCLSFVQMWDRDLSRGRKTNFRIVDCWGNKGSNYDGYFIPLLQGQLKEGHKMNDQLPNDAKPNEQNKVHCIIFTITALKCGNSEEIKALKKYYDMAIREGLYPIVVITKIDNKNKDFKTVLDQSYEKDESVVESIELLESKTGIEKQDIFCVKNFIEPGESNPVLTLKFLTILESALQKANLYFKNMESKSSSTNSNEQDEEVFYVKAAYLGDR
jgi:GTPase SAR1 family protein